FHVGVRLFFCFAALFLNYLAQSGIDILGHASGVATNKKMCAVAIEPFPNLGSLFQHFVLDIGFTGLIARPGAMTIRKKILSLIILQLVPIEIIAVLVLRSEKEPVFSFCSDCLSFL